MIAGSPSFNARPGRPLPARDHAEIRDHSPCAASLVGPGRYLDERRPPSPWLMVCFFYLHDFNGAAQAPCGLPLCPGQAKCHRQALLLAIMGCIPFCWVPVGARR